MPLVSIAGGALFAERLGFGAPRVLALHGWGRRGADFTRALTGLDALALDLPGFGASPPPPGAIGAGGYARLIGPVLEMFDLPPVVVGHSFGGRVAVMAEHQAPGTFAGMILAGVPLLPRPGRRRRPSPAYRAARLARRLGLLDEETMERLRRRHGSADYRAVSGVMRDVLVMVVNESYERQLTALAPPIRLLWGGDDLEVPVSVAEEAARMIRSGGGEVALDVVAGVGHHLPLHAPEAVRRATDEMLERVGG